MSPAQIEAHKMEQDRQMEEMQRRKMDDQTQKKKWDEMNDEMNRQMTLKERAISRNIRHMNTQIREENEELAKEQKSQIEHYERVVNTNAPTEEFFDKFNSTSR